MSYAYTRSTGLSWVEGPTSDAMRPELASDLASRFVAAILLLLAAPIIATLTLLIWCVDGGPVFYRGQRLGRGKRLFTIYKLRTLKQGSQKLLGSQLMSSSYDLLIPFGGLLRASRLDELPQLFNIMMGDMKFIGPRPERPEVYLSRCRSLENYELRFAVAPGLIGYSQLFTPHSTPKRFRTMLDNHMLKDPPTLVQETGLVLYTIYCVAKTALRCFVDRGKDFLSQFVGRKNRRGSRRVFPTGSTVMVVEPPERPLTKECTAELVDISEHAFRMRSSRPVQQGQQKFRLKVQVRTRGRCSRQSVMCVGEVRSVRKTESAYDSVVSYQPASDSSLYTIQQYVLGSSLALPARRSRRHSV